MTAALGYATPAEARWSYGGRPRSGCATASRRRSGSRTSLGFAKKLDRIQREPRVALAYHTREHGGQRPEFVLVQGRAEPVTEPTPEDRALVRRQAEQFLGSAQAGRSGTAGCASTTWCASRSGCTSERITVWPDLDCAGEPERYGLPEPVSTPDPQLAPANGTAPRVDMQRAAKRLAKTRTCCSATSTPTYPELAPVEMRRLGRDRPRS